MFIKLFATNPSPQKIQQIVSCLKNDGVIIYPTDTVYTLGCDIYNTRAVEKICRIKGIRLQKANFSFICYDLSSLSDFTLPIDSATYKLMRKVLPGPYTFILKANNKVPKLFKSKKKSVGIRVPNNEIPRMIVKELGNPIMSTSIHDEDRILAYTTNPESIFKKYNKLVDFVIDGGPGGNVPSTIIDCTGAMPTVVREGKGSLEEYLI